MDQPAHLRRPGPRTSPDRRAAGRPRPGPRPTRTSRPRADNPLAGRIWLHLDQPARRAADNIDCRKAVMYAADPTTLQTARTVARSPVATSPPACCRRTSPAPDSRTYDPNGADNKGDVDKAKAGAAACGQPNGFATNIAYRAERRRRRRRPRRCSRRWAGRHQATIKPYPVGDYFALYAGKPSYRNSNNLGLMTQRLGCGLDRRLRLPVADRRRPRHPGRPVARPT